MLEFLDNMSKTSKYNDDAIDNLLCVWCLELFANYKKILPEIVEMMPKNLKKIFLKHYSDYLD
jgi:hypothetical protein